MPNRAKLSRGRESRQGTLGMLLALCLVGAMGACQKVGPEGPIGATGPTGPAGPIGPPGTPGSSADGGGLDTSCLSPCHTFDGILSQWRVTGHAVMYTRQAGGDPISVTNWAAPNNPCGHCHSVDGLQQRAAGNLATVGGSPAGASKGQINYLNGNKLFEANYAGTARLAMVHCTTCHKMPAVDPHTTGKPYVAGTFSSYWVATGAADEALIEKSPSVGSVTGSPAGKLGTGNLCVWCHKSRRDVTNFITAQNALTNHFWGPHNAAHADIFSGAGGYHFASAKSYTTAHEHQKVEGGCVGCHMPLAENKVADHSFFPKLSTCRATCHTAAASFNVNGAQTAIRKGLTELREALNDAGYLTRGTEADQNEALSATELADALYHKDNIRFTKPPTVVGAEVAGAIYNYQLVARGAAAGAHQPIYTKQLLWDSILAIKGSAPSFIPTRP